MMNGAESLVRTLVAGGVNVCFANPGTSEMHFVAALDSVPEMRAVLGLFEGVVTGAADGYGRIAGKPAATLLHLGPGLGNGLANLHNARRAHTPVVNVVGDHATYHKQYDAPLDSDIEAVAGSLQGWVRRSATTAEVGADAAAAVAAARAHPGRVATLILPADASWGDGGLPVASGPPPPPAAVTGTTVKAIAEVLRSGEPAALLAGGPAGREAGLRALSRIAAATGARPLIETFPARLERGAGLPAIDRLAYLAELAVAQLDGVAHVILAGAKAPVSFFAYPGKPSVLAPDGAQVHTLAELDHDVVGAGKHVSVLAVEVLQTGLWRQHRQLALDRHHLGVAPQRHGPKPGTVDDDRLRYGCQDVRPVDEGLGDKTDSAPIEIRLQFGEKDRRFYQQRLVEKTWCRVMLERQSLERFPGRDQPRRELDDDIEIV